MGRYILQPEIFDILKTQTSGAGNEIQLTDAMKTLMQDQMFFAYKYRAELRLRLQAGLLERQRRFRARATRPRPKFGEELKRLAVELEAKHRGIRLKGGLT